MMDLDLGMNNWMSDGFQYPDKPVDRVSWDTVLGGIPCDEIVDNDKPWGGDHCSVEPSLVKVILLCNRRISVDSPDMVDMAPTILAALGVKPPDGLDGRSRL